MEKQSAASCPVLGGKKMVLSGHNFLQDSKVIFVEKAPGISSITDCPRVRFCRRGGGWLPGAERGRSGVSTPHGRSRSPSSGSRRVLNVAHISGYGAAPCSLAVAGPWPGPGTRLLPGFGWLLLRPSREALFCPV